jgi:hypothetical protein
MESKDHLWSFAKKLFSRPVVFYVITLVYIFLLKYRCFWPLWIDVNAVEEHGISTEYC